MKLALNLEPKIGPYGGGNALTLTLAEGLEKSGFEISFDLTKRGLDFILMLDPRWRHPLLSFTPAAMSRYVLKNRNTLIVHRINECDERKNTNFMNRKLRLANYLADSTIFVGSWLKNLDLVDREKARMRAETDIVIKNGSNQRIFYFKDENEWNGKAPLKLVTHHWSPNPMKGLALYQRFDEMLQDSFYSEKFEFTYIGNVPKEAKFTHTRVIPPLHGVDLAEELRRHHVYLTGSVNEPGGNHQNEGGLCGLPIIYVDSGCMSEYCEGFGIKIQNLGQLDFALREILESYPKFRKKMRSFSNTSDSMVEEYEKHLRYLDSRRESILKQRNLFSDPAKFLRLQLPI